MSGNPPLRTKSLKQSGTPKAQRSGTTHHSPFTIHHSQFTIHHSQFTIHNSQFTIHNSQFSRYKNVMKNIIIGGVPRSGKSILSKQLCSQLNMAYFPLDSLVSTFDRVFPQLGIAHTSASDHFAVCNRLWPFVSEWITHLVYEDLSFLIDGYHLQPENIVNDLNPQAFNVLFLGYPHAQPAQKAAEIRQHARKGDWTETLDEAALSALVRRYIEESKQIQVECLRYGFYFIDMTNNFAATLDKTLEMLLTL